MEKLNDSDIAIMASNLFDNDIRSSTLNFRLQLTPFGAKISLKKSFIKNRDGHIVIPHPSPSLKDSHEALGAKNTILENQIRSLQHDLNNFYEEL